MKLFLLFLSYVLSGTSVFAQYKVTNTIGLKVGISSTTLTGNNYKNRVGNEIELFNEAIVINSIKTYSGTIIGFCSNGAIKEGFQAFPTPPKYASNFPSGQVPQYLFADITKEIKLNYLFETILIKLQPNRDTKSFVKPYLAVGMQIAYLLSAKEKISGKSIVYTDNEKTKPITNSSEVLNETINIRSNLHKFNLLVVGNIGLAFSIRQSKIFIEGGGNYGLLSINKNGEIGATHTAAIVARVGCAFHVGTFPWFRGSND